MFSMSYKLKLKHVLSDMEDGEFKTKPEFLEVIKQFSKEDFIEYCEGLYAEYSSDNQSIKEETESEKEQDEY